MAGEQKGRGQMTVAEAGRKGGLKVAQQRGSEFYSKIGKKGGEAVSANRHHMATIGQKGGSQSRKTPSSQEK